MTAGDDGWMAVYNKLQKARKSWVWMLWISSRERVYTKVFFKAVFQTVFLFDEDTWVRTPSMERALSRFQQRVARRLTRRQPRRVGDGSWEYIPLAAVMAEVIFEDIRTYVTRSQNTVAQYIATQPIMYLCERSARRPGTWVSRRWW